MDTEIVQRNLLEKRKQLQQMTVALKERFIGLDSIIDEITSLMLPWFLFPEAQLRPMVINLWGLTGSGKTALVQSIIEFLDYKKLYTQLDMGEFESGSSSWIKNILTDDLDFFHEKQAIICLDEFQFAKTIDNKRELSRDKLRVVWELLDSGKINYIPSDSTFYLLRADACLNRIEQIMHEGVIIEKGEVVNGFDRFVELFDSFTFYDSNRFGEPLRKGYFMSRDFVEGMYWLFDENNFSRDAIRKRIQSCNLADLMDFINEGMKTRVATRQLDLSKSLIFVLGNLDEAYPMSHNLNPDISADDFHEATSHITLSDIKRALRDRFRNEQIARLGNNHIIYKSFTKSQFRTLISRELKRVGDFIYKQFGWGVHFDASVIDIVYAEGVFPAQGTRPVYTTIKNLIEAYIGKLVLQIIEYQITAFEIIWSYESEHFIYSVLNKEREVIYSFKEKINFKLENLRKVTNPQIQAHTAVHESGHAILAALTLRIVPSVVVSKTASESAEGFCLVNFPEGPMTKETLTKDIIISLGGYVAERMIFGDTYTSSGVRHDIDTATELANRAIRQYAMGTDPVRIAVECQDNEDFFFDAEKYTSEAVQIIKACEQEAENILKQNKLLLLKMSDYLTHHSRMDEAEIASFLKYYSVEEWVRTEGFIKKEDYYQFHKMLKAQIREMQQKEDAQTALEIKLTNQLQNESK